VHNMRSWMAEIEVRRVLCHVIDLQHLGGVQTLCGVSRYNFKWLRCPHLEHRDSRKRQNKLSAEDQLLVTLEHWRGVP